MALGKKNCNQRKTEKGKKIKRLCLAFYQMFIWLKDSMQKTQEETVNCKTTSEEVKTSELQLLTLLAKKTLHIQCPGDRVLQLL